jgi:hypothetical protein
VEPRGFEPLTSAVPWRGGFLGASESWQYICILAYFLYMRLPSFHVIYSGCCAVTASPMYRLSTFRVNVCLRMCLPGLSGLPYHAGVSSPNP